MGARQPAEAPLVDLHHPRALQRRRVRDAHAVAYCATTQERRVIPRVALALVLLVVSVAVLVAAAAAAPRRARPHALVHLGERLSLVGLEPEGGNVSPIISAQHALLLGRRAEQGEGRGEVRAGRALGQSGGGGRLAQHVATSTR